MMNSKREHFDRLIRMSMMLCFLTVLLSVTIATIAAFNGDFLASGVCLIPASLSSGSLLICLVR